jgi:hypothetical protein
MLGMHCYKAILVRKAPGTPAWLQARPQRELADNPGFTFPLDGDTGRCVSRATFTPILRINALVKADRD